MNLADGDLAGRESVGTELVAIGEASIAPIAIAPDRPSITLPDFGADVPVGLSLYRRSSEVDGVDVIAFAQDLLRLGVLRESDWQGDVAGSIEFGLRRWVTFDLGAYNLKFLHPLRLDYTNDARRYFIKMDDSLWRNEIKAVRDRPIGFFALSWQKEQGRLTPVFVGEKIQALEDDFAGVGYGLCALLGYAFRWSCNGLGFDWGLDAAQSAENMALEYHENEFLQSDTNPETDEQGNQAQADYDAEPYAVWMEMFQDRLHDPDEGILSTVSFTRIIPEAACSDKFSPDKLASAAERTKTTHVKGERRWRHLLADCMELMMMIDDCTRTHVGNDHLVLIGNGGRRMSRNGSVYLSWSPVDEMHRIVDDLFHHASAFTGPNLSDLCWLHGFQLERSGKQTRAATRQMNYLRKNAPQMTEKFQFAADGSLEAAVASTKRCVEMCVLLDRILVQLHTPHETSAPTAAYPGGLDMPIRAMMAW